MNDISFPAPEGFAAPEDSKPGQPFEVMATLTMGEGGLLTLTAIDGAPVSVEQEPAEDGEEAPEMEVEMSAPANGDFLAAIEQGISKGGPKGASK
jgi:hypothetical protein